MPRTAPDLAALEGFDLEPTTLGVLALARREWLDLAIDIAAEHPWYALGAWMDLTGKASVGWLPWTSLRTFATLGKLPGKTAAALIEAFTKIPATSWDRWRVLDDNTRAALRARFLASVAAAAVTA